MSSKPTKTAGKSGQDVKQEDVIQAVVIADSFSTRFAPITETKPKALLPLVNRPMIDYTLEFLLLSGVQRAIVYCVSHADQIREYLKNSKWTRTVSPMTIQILSSPDCTSLGDALRDIDKMSLIRSEFILLTSFVVSNAQLIPILEKHKERKTTDKGLIMTHIFGQSFPGHQTSTPEEEFVMAVDPSTEQILHYQKTDSVNKLRFPLKLFKEKTSLDLRFDLMDTHISICSPTVLELFSDNFDYQTWDHFVKGILIDDEILGNNIYMHQLEGAYGAQVSNIHMYDAISKDIIRRWTFPLVPDMNRGPDTPRHTLSRHNVYQQPDVTLARGSVLEINVVVGQSSCIGESTHVTQSVIGRRCKIGNNVSISGSYVWNDVTVKDGCRIESALIADGVVLNENVEIYRGCVIGPGVSLAADTKVPPNTRLVAQPQELGDDDFGPSEGTDSEPTVAPLSVGSRAYVYQNDGQDESDAESLVDDPWGVDPAENDDEDETEDKDEYDDDEDEGADVGEEDDAEDGEDVDQRSDSSPLPEDARFFYDEVLDSLLRGYEEKVSCENLVTEINASKHAYNISIDEVNILVTKSILSLPDALDQDRAGDSVAYLNALKKILVFYLPLLRNYMKSKTSQVQCMGAMETYGASHATFVPCMAKILHLLYEKDLFSDEAILEWFSKTSTDSPVRQSVQPFISWLEESDEDSDDESD